jgi:hypothetical protein
VRIEPDAILRFRARAQHLVERVAAHELAVAAWGGLQDSAPRSGLLSLHARADGVDPSSWEDPALVQVWGPRMAVYVVPRADVAVFTLGRSPRDAQAMAALEAVARDPTGDVRLLRPAAVTGRLHLRWDARTTVVLAADPGDADAEEARRELARRFLRWHGPATAAHFAAWAACARRTR